MWAFARVFSFGEKIIVRGVFRGISRGFFLWGVRSTGFVFLRAFVRVFFLGHPVCFRRGLRRIHRGFVLSYS